jgi:hypothetical protein
VTPPRPTAPTAAELRDLMLLQSSSGHPRVVSPAALDALIAAARADALELAVAAMKDESHLWDGDSAEIATLLIERIRALVSK